MANDFFNFKQFTIKQDKSAMKVCTDACVLGAWAADKIEQLNLTPNKILDIGCGTGLLSLMLAQKTSATIDAVEINTDAAAQARENISQSPWKERIQVNNIALQEFAATGKYDFIICNPPFFEDDLRSPDETKNAAKHDAALKFDDLIIFIKQNLATDGFAAVLIPYQRTDHFAALLKKINSLLQKHCLLNNHLLILIFVLYYYALTILSSLSKAMNWLFMIRKEIIQRSL